TLTKEFFRLPAKLPNKDDVERWTLFTDEASSSKGSEAGLVLISPSSAEYTYALRLNFTNMNNEAEYEALLAGLHMARKMKVQNIDVKVDSKLVVSQINGSYVASSTSIIKYLATTKECIVEFKTFDIQNIPRTLNEKADILSKLATHVFDHLTKKVLVEVLTERSTDRKEIGAIVEEEEDNWMTPIIRCMAEGVWPKDKDERKSLRMKINQGIHIDKFVCDPNKTPYSSQRPPQDCPKCENPVYGLYCRHCALLQKKLKEQKFSKDFLNTFESSNDDSNVVSMPQEPIVFNQDPGENSSQSPPHIDHHCCYGCSDSLDDIFCQRYTCKSCRNDAHHGYNCPPKVLIISNPEPCHDQNVESSHKLCQVFIQHAILEMKIHSLMIQLLILSRILKKLKEQKFSKDFLNTSESSNDDSNVVSMPQEPIVFNQDPDENSSQSPPHIDHHCCYGCSDSLDDIFCQ
nr:reverse transcriptase domain-containing protein [Tanacetum cinerariifolium]